MILQYENKGKQAAIGRKGKGMSVYWYVRYLIVSNLMLTITFRCRY
jgi:hypothetical protein